MHSSSVELHFHSIRCQKVVKLYCRLDHNSHRINAHAPVHVIVNEGFFLYPKWANSKLHVEVKHSSLFTLSNCLLETFIILQKLYGFYFC